MAVEPIGERPQEDVNQLKRLAILAVAEVDAAEWPVAPVAFPLKRPIQY
jgi:hypothetical protein